MHAEENTNTETTKALKLATKCITTIGSFGEAVHICETKSSSNLISEDHQNPIVLDPKFCMNGVNDRCNKYIDKKGEYGPWGKIVLNAISKINQEELKKTFYSNSIPDMDYICPQFNNFDEELKNKFWVWTIASLSWQESSCISTRESEGINCRAVGLLQLEDAYHLRSWRGPACRTRDMLQPANNLSCGIQILHDQLLGAEGKRMPASTGELFWKSSYWQEMRFKKKNEDRMKRLKARALDPESKSKPEIKELIMRFPMCRSPKD